MARFFLNIFYKDKYVKVLIILYIYVNFNIEIFKFIINLLLNMKNTKCIHSSFQEHRKKLNFY